MGSIGTTESQDRLEREIETKSIFPSHANTQDYARHLDSTDPLRGFREKFIIPSKSALQSKSLPKTDAERTSNEEGVYFCGNSLGLQPKCAADFIKAQLDTWASVAVGGHFLQLDGSPLRPWQSMAEYAAELSAPLFGASANEIGIQNTLSVNLHLLMASFYLPTAKRNKILLETRAFPSDHYIVESQITWHGYDPKQSMILLEPDHDQIITTDNILQTIDKHVDEIALILLPGIQYYSGQLLDIPRITSHAHARGLTIGWDLAHAAGNVPLKLHEWNVDFAAWCTYKYMNSGPGGIAGMFVNEKYGKVEYEAGSDEPIYRPRLTGWYGGDKASRFQMNNRFRPIPGAGGYQVSNPSAIDLASLCASLSVFGQTSIEDLRAKSLKLTAYLQYLLLKDTSEDDEQRPFRIITPLDPTQRGAQLSLLLKPGHLERVGAALHEAGIVVDQRKPDVIRVAPVPLYNSFEDVCRFVEVFKKVVTG